MDFIDYDYEEIRDDVFELFGNLLENSNAESAEKYFFALDGDEIPDAFLSHLATAVYEIKKGILTENIKEKTKGYISEFKSGKYDDFIIDSDIKDIKKDIKYFEDNI